MDNQIFRQKSLDQISSPEQLHDYLRVPNPTIWLIMAAVILLIAGAWLWSSLATTNMFVSGTADVSNGSMVIRVDDPQMTDLVKAGMKVLVGDSSEKISSIGYNADGSSFAVAETELADGTYTAKVILRQTEIMRLLFN